MKCLGMKQIEAEKYIIRKWETANGELLGQKAESELMELTCHRNRKIHNETFE